MAAKRADAMAQLDAAVQRLHEPHKPNECGARWRAYRRALRALLRERAEAAVWAANNVRYGRDGAPMKPSLLALRAAVLGRRKP